MQVLKEFRESEISYENKPKSYVLSDNRDNLKAQQKLYVNHMFIENNGKEAKLNNSIENQTVIERSMPMLNNSIKNLAVIERSMSKLNDSIENLSAIERSDVCSNEMRPNDISKIFSNEVKSYVKPYVLQNQVLIEELMGLGGRRVLKDFLHLLSRVDAWERGYKEVIGDRLVGGRRVEEDQLESEEKKVIQLIQEYRRLSTKTYI